MALQKLDPQSHRNMMEQVFDPKQMSQPAFLRSHPPTHLRVRELLEVATEDESKRQSVVATLNDKQTVKRNGESVVYIGYPEVRERKRYRASSGIYR